MQKHMINPLLSQVAPAYSLEPPHAVFSSTNGGPAWTTGINTANWH